MRRSFYILKNGSLIRKQNTVYFVGEGVRRALPISQIYAIYAYGMLTVTSQALLFLAKHGIPVHFFNYYGYYAGTFYPREKLISGDLLIRQVEHYLSKEKRCYLARKFVEGTIKNMQKVLSRYKFELDGNFIERLETAKEISNIMGIEAEARRAYYSKLDEILPENFRIGVRTRRPPGNYTNALISFGNSLLYATVLGELYNTQLNPTVSYLHEPSERRFSLALDLAEIFKPFLVDRLILKLVNKGIITQSDFMEEVNGVLLNEKGKRKFLTYWERRLGRTIKHRKLRRNVSYRRLIRLEAYKLIKHLLGVERYEPFVIWW